MNKQLISEISEDLAVRLEYNTYNPNNVKHKIILKDLLKEYDVTEDEYKSLDENATQLNEASIMDRKYGTGHTVVVSKVESQFKGLLNVGDIVEIVADETDRDYDFLPPKVTPDQVKMSRTLKFPNGKTYRFGGTERESFGTMFIHDKNSSNSAPSGEEWESLIVVAYNEEKKGKEWDIAEKFWKQYADPAEAVAMDLKKKIGASKLTRYGSTSSALSSEWKGKDKTPKTDILADNGIHISLKKSGGSQLMSGAVEETLSTFESAMKLVGENKPKELESVIDLINDKMGKMSVKGTITQWKKLRDSGESLTPEQEAAIAEMEELHMNANEITKAMERVFADSYFKQCFCFEAATGTNKFSSKEAIANALVEFDPSSMKIQHYVPIMSIPDAGVLAKNNTFYVSFKSGGSSSKPYLALRTKSLSKDMISEGEEYMPTMREIISEEFNNNNLFGILTEGEDLERLDEFNLLKKAVSKIKDMSGKIKDQIMNVVNTIIERISKAFDMIKQMGKKMFKSLLHFLGFEVEDIAIKTGGPFPLV